MHYHPSGGILWKKEDHLEDFLIMKVVDMHCDTIAEIYERRKKGESIDLRKNGLHLDLEKMKKGDYFLQNFALFTALKNVERPFEHTCRLAETFYEEMEANKDLIGAVKTYDDIEENWKKGKMSALLTIEEGGVCQGDLMLLRFFYHLGVRMMTLTWNYPNELGYPNRLASNSSYFPSNGADDTVLGLTEKGIQFVEEMERLGMIVDVSHLNDAGFWDVIRYTKKPFVASHSNARALVPDCPRDLTDDMIRALSERGGVVGINYFPPFLSAQDPKADRSAYQSRISDMIRHMKHMKQVGGIQCIGLGSDFDGIHGDLEMKDSSELPKLEWAMRKEGFTESEIEAVFYGNVLRVYKEVL